VRWFDPIPASRSTASGDGDREHYRRDRASLLSPTLARRLQDAEANFAALPTASVTRTDELLRALPQAVERYKAMVENSRRRP
jgi:hypothetical protein